MLEAVELDTRDKTEPVEQIPWQARARKFEARSSSTGRRYYLGLNLPNTHKSIAGLLIASI